MESLTLEPPWMTTGAEPTTSATYNHHIGLQASHLGLQASHMGLQPAAHGVAADDGGHRAPAVDAQQPWG